MNDAPVSRDEFHMLRAAVADNMRRLEQTQTTANGIAVLSAQLTEVIKDVTDVRRELADFRHDHERRHDKEAASRLSARRWAVGAAIGALASLWAPLVYLISHIR